jgi:ATP-dependent exoDNAse (exonuclease V) alpha subunit
MILFQPFYYEFKPFPGLAAGLIPIFPSKVKFTIHDSKNPKTQINRWQFAVMGGYAFTNHKSQGQTIEYTIVDISPTQRFLVDAFAYVALSRSRGRETIKLLRDFDDRNILQNTSRLRLTIW